MYVWKNSVGGLVLGLCLITAVFCIAVLSGMGDRSESETIPPEGTVSDAEQRSAVNVVEEFGRRLQYVPLSGEQEVTKAAMQEHYADVLGVSLLAEWNAHPTLVLGRQTSSPWPDRISITHIQEDQGIFVISGDILEVANGSEGIQVVTRIPIELRVEKQEDRYRITSAKNLGTGVSENITIEGMLTCLPKKGDGPQTMECAYGLQADDGQYYALDFNALEFEVWSAVSTEERIRVRGSFVPAEALSSDQWQTYYMRGIIRVDAIEH